MRNSICFLFVLSISLTGCKKNEPQPIGEKPFEAGLIARNALPWPQEFTYVLNNGSEWSKTALKVTNSTFLRNGKTYGLDSTQYFAALITKIYKDKNNFFLLSFDGIPQRTGKQNTFIVASIINYVEGNDDDYQNFGNYIIDATYANTVEVLRYETVESPIDGPPVMLIELSFKLRFKLNGYEDAEYWRRKLEIVPELKEYEPVIFLNGRIRTRMSGKKFG